MGKFKEQFITIIELIDNNMPLQKIADMFGMSIDEVTKIAVSTGRYFEPVGIDDETT